ncbi:MAG: 50S ribosomal protein L15e [Nanoarchaeota archaeon]
MGTYKYLREFWQDKARYKPILQKYMIEWRKDNSIVKIERPLRLDRARSLGYKAKKGFILARVRILRGGKLRQKFKGGRRSKAMRRRKVLGKNYQWIAEERANRKFKNLTVLNSYQIGKDGKHYFFEVILVDPEIVKNYEGFEWLKDKNNRGRVYHGKTSAGKKSRGLYNKGKGTEKLRPSRSAVFRKKIREQRKVGKV